MKTDSAIKLFAGVAVCFMGLFVAKELGFFGGQVVTCPPGLTKCADGTCKYDCAGIVTTTAPPVSFNGCPVGYNLPSAPRHQQV